MFLTAFSNASFIKLISLKRWGQLTARVHILGIVWPYYINSLNQINTLQGY
jgi:hypothetical protein